MGEVVRPVLDIDGFLGRFVEVIRALTYLLTPLRTILMPRPRSPLIGLSSPSRRCSASRGWRGWSQQPPNPLNPCNRTLQPLQPFPLLHVPPLQPLNPLLQFSPRLPLRRHHL